METPPARMVMTGCSSVPIQLLARRYWRRAGMSSMSSEDRAIELIPTWHGRPARDTRVLAWRRLPPITGGTPVPLMPGWPGRAMMQNWYL